MKKQREKREKIVLMSSALLQFETKKFRWVRLFSSMTSMMMARNKKNIEVVMMVDSGGGGGGGY